MSDQGYIRPRFAFTEGLAEFDAGKGGTNLNVSSQFSKGKFQKPDFRLTHNFTPNLQGYAEDVKGKQKIGVRFKAKF
mgnify:CR=1 FL=1